jgi:uncharacterized protein (DUF2236 family)
MTALAEPTEAPGAARDAQQYGVPSQRLGDFIAEASLMLGAGSAVMYQLAMKGVGLGVAEHSTALVRPADRLRTTLSYVYVMTMGTQEERDVVSRLVNKAHVPVRSSGRYTAFDPDLQLWVAVTLAQNTWIHERVFGKFDAATREQVYRDSQVFGTALQVKPEDYPQTWADYQAYWEDVLDNRIEQDPLVQAYAKRLLSPAGMPLHLKPAVMVQGLLTRGNLDPRARQVLALPWSKRDQRLYDLFWKAFVPVYRALPTWLRQAHGRSVLRDARRRIRGNKHLI